ncbi:hypothetical protein ACP6L2_00285 [Sphingobacterium lactis]|uniref:hypothetical protein n=1 Tax=Sphingobacterium lactis TaxID=797291 RepID=UPI003F7F8B43
MNKSTYILLLILFLTSISKAQSLPQIGETWKGKIDTFNRILISPSQFVKSADLTVDKIQYKIGVDKAKKVVLISTIDKNFRIADQTCIGMNFSDVAEDKEIVLEKGWATFVSIGEGWYAAADPKDYDKDSKVLFVFKRS